MHVRLMFGLALASLAGAVSLGQQPPARPADPTARIDYTGYQLVEVTLSTPADVDTMLAITPHFWGEGVGIGAVPFYVSPAELARLDESGLPYRALHDNIQALIDAERAVDVTRGGWFADYKTYDQINAHMDTLVAQRPDLVSKFAVGASLQGRTIYGIEITSPVGADKPGVCFTACQHAREWISPMTAMYIATELVSGYGAAPEITDILDELVVYVIPVVNPDGYVYTWTSNRLWRKNRRNNGGGSFGVDLNRNWPYEWGGPGSSGNPNSETYRGTAPASEPETQVVRDFFLAHPEIIAHIDFHSYSQLILFPFGYEDDPPDPPEPDHTRLVNLGAGMADAILATTGEPYTDQESWVLYPAAGNVPDWVYGTLGAMSFTIELRPDTANPGFLLPASEIVPTGQESFAAASVLMDFARLLLDFHFPAPLPTVIEPGVATDVQVTILGVNGTLAPGTAMLHARVGGSGPFTATPLTSVGSDTYQGALPAAACGQVVQFYFSAQTTGGQTVTEPPDAAATFFQADVLVTEIAFADDMEADLGWTVGAPGDTATSGVWNRMNPQPTPAQPGDDHTPGGTICWVTDGNAGGGIGSNDVDGGRTTLTSPALDLSAMSDPLVSYWRWYSNNQGSAPNADLFRVQISSDGVTWQDAEIVGPAGPEAAGGWYSHEFRVLDFVPLSSAVRVRFIAADEGSGSIVEAAVDDFTVRDVGCPEPPPCPGDVDGSGAVDITDLGTLLSNFGLSGATPEQGDLTGDGLVDISDLGVLLANFGATCP